MHSKAATTESQQAVAIVKAEKLEAEYVSQNVRVKSEPRKSLTYKRASTKDFPQHGTLIIFNSLSSYFFGAFFWH